VPIGCNSCGSYFNRYITLRHPGLHYIKWTVFEAPRASEPNDRRLKISYMTSLGATFLISFQGLFGSQD
jgi:hypothetical protein